MDWVQTFPAVFGQPRSKTVHISCAARRPHTAARIAKDNPSPSPIPLPVPGFGFDAVIGNPPWERMKVQGAGIFSRSPRRTLHRQ